MGLRGLYKPIAHNELVDIGTDAILGDGSNLGFGTVAGRPAVVNDGRQRFYYASDTDQMFLDRGDGTAWLEVLRRESATTGASAESVGKYEIGAQ